MPNATTHAEVRNAGTIQLAEVLVKNAEGLHPDRLLQLSVMRGAYVTVYSMRGGVHGSHSIGEPNGRSGGWARLVAHWEGYVRATVREMAGTIVGSLGLGDLDESTVCAMLDRACARDGTPPQ